MNKSLIVAHFPVAIVGIFGVVVDYSTAVDRSAVIDPAALVIRNYGRGDWYETLVLKMDLTWRNTRELQIESALGIVRGEKRSFRESAFTDSLVVLQYRT